MPDAIVKRTALISDCGRYRHSLGRRWNKDGKTVCFVMLNPSMANALRDDPTVTRCIGYARRWGFGGLLIANLFAFRATDPAKLATVSNPVGPENDTYLKALGGLADLVVGGWGANPFARERAQAVRALLTGERIVLHCLTVTKSGAPGHPLFLCGNLTPRVWSPPPRKEKT